MHQETASRYIRTRSEDIPESKLAKANAQKTLETFKSLGVTQFIPLNIPTESFPDIGSFNVESSSFFTELLKSGREKFLTSPTRGAGFKAAHLIPAVDYIQGQRARMMMMMKLADLTKDVDVYICELRPELVVVVRVEAHQEQRELLVQALAVAGLLPGYRKSAAPATALDDGKFRVLSGAEHAKWFQRCGNTHPDQLHDFRQTVWRDGIAGVWEGLSGCRGICVEASGFDVIEKDLPGRLKDLGDVKIELIRRVSLLESLNRQPPMRFSSIFEFYIFSFPRSFNRSGRSFSFVTVCLNAAERNLRGNFQSVCFKGNEFAGMVRDDAH